MSSTPAVFTSPEHAQLPITVYYDHSCVLCRSEVESLTARDTQGALNVIDCSGADFDVSQLPFDQMTLMRCIHAIDAKGQWLKGTDVFIVCYRAAHMQSIARVLSLTKPVVERIYPWVVRHRHGLSKLGVHKLFNWLTYRAVQHQADRAMALSQGCKHGVCEAPSSSVDKVKS